MKGSVVKVLAMYVCVMYVCMYVCGIKAEDCMVYGYNSNSFKDCSLSFDVGALTDSFMTLAKIDAILSPM